ncbi:MAG: hypothetical protein IT463_08710 [Planctomycetes bacterium]|nr:hypothetical protein [Planctomycetota bacterium]
METKRGMMMHNLDSKGLKALSAVLLLGGALLLSGCPGDDDDGGSGACGIGGPPTARPTLTGLTPVIDVSAGNGTAGNGGVGGSASLSAAHGLIRVGGSAPGVDNNFLTTGVLADNTVTYTELAAIDPGSFYLNGTTAEFDLYGKDFWLPNGATLNMTGAVSGVVDTIVIRTHKAGDVIRIDGIVNTSRAGADNVALALLGGLEPGVSVAVTGLINANGAGTRPGGNVFLFADWGHVALTGKVTAIGSDDTVGDDGGSVLVVADRGDIWMASGVVVSNGGDGTVAGGDGGTLNVSTGVSGGFYHGLRANGGDGGTSIGGNGGQANLYQSMVVDDFFAAEMNGGDSTSDDGGDGGEIVLQGEIVRGAVVLTANGGNGGNGAGDLGGDGGGFGNGGSGTANLQSLALQATALGGDGEQGGDGGISAITTYGSIEQVLVDVLATGGAGVSAGGDGGGCNIVSYTVCKNLTIEVDAVGGSASSATGTGGDGGEGRLDAGGVGASSTGPVWINVTAHGGNAPTGTLGGDGGNAIVIQGAMLPFGTGQCYLTLLANGGTAGAAAGVGGDGGAVAGQVGLSAAALDLTVNVTANGAQSPTGGNGGGAAISLDSPPQGGRIHVTGTVVARGGTSTGAAATGGTGGFGVLTCGSLGYFQATNLSMDLRGGDSTSGNGGAGGQILGEFFGDVWVTGGVYDTSGGTGGTSSNGGEGGDQSWAGENVDMYFAAGTIFRANGGNGPSGGGNGASDASATVFGLEFTPDRGDDGRGAYIYFAATAEAKGGNATVAGDGGDGGEVGIDNFDNSTAYSYSGFSEFRGVFDASGGNGAGAASVGGGGGYCDVDSNGDGTYVNGTIRANGGNGATGGDGGDVALYGNDASGAAGITVTVYGLVQANGGTGTTAGGDGGAIAVSNQSGDALDVVVGGQLEVNGGAGPTGGDAGAIAIGDNAETSITIASSARLYANGGATGGDGGTIDIDPAGTGGLANPNLDEQAGSVIQANANGGGAVGAITRD